VPERSRDHSRDSRHSLEENDAVQVLGQRLGEREPGRKGARKKEGVARGVSYLSHKLPGSKVFRFQDYHLVRG